MIVNREHPKFDLSKEILATLPKHPNSVPIKLLVEDMGCRKQDEIYAQIDKLRGEGRNIMTHNDDVSGSGRVCSIHPSDWPKASAIAQNYWEQVN